MIAFMERLWPVLAGLTLVAGCAGGGPAERPARVAPVTRIRAAPRFARAIDSARALLQDVTRDGPGVAVAVYDRGEPVWVEGLGYADPSEGTPVDPRHTLFRLYSVSKAMTAVAGVRLMARGALDPAAPVQRYVPQFPRKSAPITAVQLATHTSGIRHYASEAEAASGRHCATLDEALEVFEDDPLVHAPGAGESYSSWGYVLLSAVVAGAADAPFMDAMQDLVFAPAGMEHAALGGGPVPEPAGHATYYEEIDGTLHAARPVDNSCKWGAGAFLTTADDAARFGAAMLDGTLLSLRDLQLFLRGSEVYQVQGVGVGGTAFLLVDTGPGLSMALLSNTSGNTVGPRLKQAVAMIHEAFSTRATTADTSR